MTSQAQAIKLTQLNLTAIFGEADPQTRNKTIADLWVPSNQVFFLDSSSVLKSHEAISDMVGHIQSLGGPGDKFVELGEVECLKHDEQDDVWVTRVKWGVQVPGGGFSLTGLDVLTIVGGKIKACYTFLDAK